jgi:3-methyladenine DNA glycosylase AlkC
MNFNHSLNSKEVKFKLSSNISAKEVRNLGKIAIDYLKNGSETEFFRITEELLCGKKPFRIYSIFGTAIGKEGLANPNYYLGIIDKLFNKDWFYGYNPRHFNLNDPKKKRYWTEDKIKALILGARISIITTALGIIGEKYPKRVIPVVKKYLIDGDGWYICDGLSITLGMILRKHFDETLPILVSWTKEENKWLRRASVVSVHALLKQSDERVKDAIIIFELLKRDNNRLVKMGLAWMLREMAKNYKVELVGIVTAWKNIDDKNTKWIIKHGSTKLNEEEKSY